MNDLAIALNQPRAVKLTVADFLLLADADRVGRWRRAELLDGMIVEMGPEYRRHSRIWATVFRRIIDAVERRGANLEVLLDVSVAMPPHNLPQPDIVVCVPRNAENAPVDLSDVRLIVEVSDTSARHDLTSKARLYASMNVAEYWVVDIDSGCVRRHLNPRDDAYGTIDAILFGELVSSGTIPDLTIETAGL